MEHPKVFSNVVFVKTVSNFGKVWLGVNLVKALLHDHVNPSSIFGGHFKCKLTKV